MKITAIRLRHVTGTFETDGPFWEERLARPIDIYPEYGGPLQGWGGRQIDDRHFRTEQVFLQIETDDGVSGVAGPIEIPVAQAVARLRPMLLGRDPVAHEKLWDQMHRAGVHGRHGHAMMAISAVDCALWDLKGRWLNVPVHRLLGGPTRDTVPAYVSTLGYNVLDMGLVRERALMLQAKGFRAQKWFFRHGPASGREGLRLNTELVATLRNALGEDDELMFDCWQAFDVPYTLELLGRITEFRPRWLEECVMTDRIDSYVRIKRYTGVPMAGGEHDYTRWGLRRYIDAGCLDVMQPDLYWAGGLSEVLKIAAYASAHDLMTIPHGHSSPAGAQFSFAQSPAHTPMQEYLVRWDVITQYFLRNPIHPVNGAFEIPVLPGMGMELEPTRIETETEIYP